ncbi:Ribosomal protein S7 [Ignavibacterium album JCM 16511]|jgi:small subunit ribosomal protein S7|uniref:Small ribosomal subunit protein uS7 n=3 Tax=Ignavibacteriaceae TaxID=795749 RepID=I0AI13_IGNAJ|nr:MULTISPECIES: 30S ribosomal protein S7 [Ignavibacterium]AFH48620.1 Ribosomal protein S7 [Ignavibacterium album JCM 16511]MCA2004652.1 30S ribosomal protein S7 [Ignavibacterium sp.]MCL6493480.1 30S ribosomal protein S7 [Ignavibacterium sp.]MCX8105541.1 30S ribosomal protein S7 [Ignavibacterium album]BDQ04365.1 MAG: 30S ribosomal protein S7 [Ignavibacterium sp.]
MRKRRAEKRYVKPDPKYNDVLVAKFINSIMLRGKKSTARNIVYTAFDIIEEKSKKSGLEVFKKAISNVAPVIEVRSRRVGGATYQVPTEVRPERRTALAMRWIKTYSRARGEKSMAAKLAGELLAASNNEGSSVKKKEDTHKMAEANKAFAHFKW